MTTRNPTQFERLMSAAQQGIHSFVQAYKQDYFVAESEFEWDSYPARMARYWYNRRYVDNTIYSNVNRYAAWFKESEKLYKHLRGLYNPMSRLVNIEKAKIFGGFINYETFKDGAMPIVGADDTLLEAIRKIWKWSDMDALKTLIPAEGGTMGDIAIKIVDNVNKGKVYLEILDPRKVQTVNFDSRGNVKDVFISYERYDEVRKRWYEYGEEINVDYFQTYRDGEPYAYMEDANGQSVSKWANPYGFVPIQWIKHTDVGMLFGATSFHNTRSKVDNLNDLASLLHDNIRTVVRTKYAVTDVQIPMDANGNPLTISMSTDERDKAPFIKLGKDGDIKPIAFPLDIMSTLAAIEAQTNEIQADLPQLALQNMRQNVGNTSGVAIENLYSDASDIIQERQGTYIAGVKAATQMAISIAAFRRLDGFTAYNLDSYENGSLDFDLRPKPLFQDVLSTKEKLDLTIQAVNSEASSLILPQLGYAPDDIAEIEVKKDARAREQMRNAFEGLFPANQDENV